MKKMGIIFILPLAFCLSVHACSKKPPTIDELVVHFENSGLSVGDPPPLSDREKAAVEKTRNTLERIGAGKKSKLIESKRIMIDSIKLKIRRYQDVSVAQAVYNECIKREEKKKLRAHKRDTSYTKTTYLQKEAFIILIRHWTVKSLDQFYPEEVDVPESLIDDIQAALNQFSQ